MQVETEPGQALMNMVYEAAANVAFYRCKIADMQDDHYVDDDAIEQLDVVVKQYELERDRLSRPSMAAREACIDGDLGRRGGAWTTAGV